MSGNVCRRFKLWTYLWVLLSLIFLHSANDVKAGFNATSATQNTGIAMAVVQSSVIDLSQTATINVWLDVIQTSLAVSAGDPVR
jgi:hypothetical protein